jgi:hypothetical protein
VCKLQGWISVQGIISIGKIGGMKGDELRIRAYLHHQRWLLQRGNVYVLRVLISMAYERSLKKLDN